MAEKTECYGLFLILDQPWMEHHVAALWIPSIIPEDSDDRSLLPDARKGRIGEAGVATCQVVGE
jgi:hypothetical protein